MAMGVDEAGNDGLAAGVDFSHSARKLHLCAHGYDAAIADEQRRVFDCGPASAIDDASADPSLAGIGFSLCISFFFLGVG